MQKHKQQGIKTVVRKGPFGLCALAAAALLSAPTAQAAVVNSTFTGAVDTDFSTAGNWDTGIAPSNADDTGSTATIKDGLTADISSNVNLGGRYTVTVGADGTSGTLNLGSAEYKVFSLPVNLGVGAGSVGTFNLVSGSNLEIIGGSSSAFLNVGDGAGGQGFFNTATGATLEIRGGFNLTNGTVVIDHGVTIASNTLREDTTIGDDGTLVFKTDGADVTTLAMNVVGTTTPDLVIASGSTLDMQLDGAYTVGDTWTIFSGSTSITGTFGNVVDSTNGTNQFVVHYGTGPAAAGEVVVELVPEPGSLALLGLGGLMIARRRRA